MDISYAQNLEDYYLSRAFEGQETGFYIDVGAGHPVAGNVSCWFYLHGWRGIVVEPQENLLELYSRIRPRDIREGCALGTQAGEVSFHQFGRLHGFSTVVAETAEAAAGFGDPFQTRRVRMDTLAALCTRHGVAQIDFLKVDVEGAEGDVLAGNDWTRFRPRVVICEILSPGSSENWREWERTLLGHGYDYVLFDDLNRYYVAREDKALLARFPREKAEWLVVPHLDHTNRAPFRTDHPDHAFAKALTGAFMANLPMLDRALQQRLVMQAAEVDPNAPLTSQERARIIDRLFPPGEARTGLDALDAANAGAFCEKIVASDAFGLMTGRLAMSWDGGQILNEEDS
jgi:FkbM family methyltransferase